VTAPELRIAFHLLFPLLVCCKPHGVATARAQCRLIGVVSKDAKQTRVISIILKVKRLEIVAVLTVVFYLERGYYVMVFNLLQLQGGFIHT
jgi:hypothetical protein